MNYFVLIRNSMGSKTFETGHAILRDVVGVVEYRNFVAFHCADRNTIIVPHEWMFDFGPIEDDILDVVRPKPAGVDPERACRILDSIIQSLDPLWEGGATDEIV